MWDIETTDDFAGWYATLGTAVADRVGKAVDMLSARGPTLGRPLVDRVASSRHHHMKELRVRMSERHVRVLFAFDPRRVAILLVGGDKAGDWTGWYVRAVRRADDLLDAHLERLRDEGTPQ